MKIHMISHIQVCSLTTYYILSTRFGKPSVELYALKLMKGFHQQLAHLPSSWLVNQACSISRHLAQQRAHTWHKSTTMWKASQGLSHRGDNPTTSKIAFDDIKEFFLLKNGTLSISQGGNQITSTSMDFLKYECELYLKPSLTPPQCKIIVAYRTSNCRLPIQFGQWSTIPISSNSLFFVWHKLRNPVASETTYYAGFFLFL